MENQTAVRNIEGLIKLLSQIELNFTQQNFNI